MRVREYEFDGTVEEFERAAPTLRASLSSNTRTEGQPLVDVSENHDNASAGRFVTPKQAHRIFSAPAGAGGNDEQCLGIW
jgi:hypothetical protein